MRLRRRIVTAVTAAFLGFTVGAFVLGDARDDAFQAETIDLSLAAFERSWSTGVARWSEDLRALVAPEAEVLSEFAPQLGPERLAIGLAAVHGRLRERGLLGLQLLGPDGQVAVSTGEDVRMTTTLIDAGPAREALAAGRPVQGMVRVGDSLLLAAAVHIVLDRGQSGVLVATRDPGTLLENLSGPSGPAVALSDGEGRFLVPARGLRERVQVAERARVSGRGRQEVATGEQIFEIVNLPLLDIGGQRVGYQRWVTDATERRWVTERGRWLSALALAAMAGGLAFALSVWLRLAFRPLEETVDALRALARGDTTIEITAADRRDEIGETARALAVFREGQMVVQRDGQRLARQRRRQLGFIEDQMQRLAATLESEARSGMMEDLQRIKGAAGPKEGSEGLDALAFAFRVMVERVSQQHSSLRQLIAAKDEALAVREKMEALEQQLSVVGSMQAQMVPAAMPATAHVAVRGRLIQGDRFGGEFYDFFWLDGAERRRLAVVMASVSGEGLQAAFLAISARALVRALAPGAASPGQCLARLSDLLVGDNEARLEVKMFFGVIDVVDGLLVAARAASPAPLVARRPGEATALEIEGAPPLALRPGIRVPDTTVELPPRGALLLFSEGLSETRIGATAIGVDGVRAMLGATGDLDVEPLSADLAERLDAPGVQRPGDASFVAVRLLGG